MTHIQVTSNAKLIAQARARIDGRVALAEIEKAHQLKVAAMRQAGHTQVLLVAAKISFVRQGGRRLDELTEERFDAAWNMNMRSGIHGSDSAYDTALMGGEPYAVWN